MLFSFDDCLAGAKWNEYYSGPFYYNYEGSNIEVMDLPLLPLEKRNRISFSDIQSSSLIPVGESMYSVLDSLIRFDIIKNYNWVQNRDNRGRVVLKLCNKRIEISNQIDSYLVYVAGIDEMSHLPKIYLANVKNGCLKSVIFLSGKYDEMNVHLRGRPLDYYGKDYYNLLEGKIETQWEEGRTKHLTRISMDSQGYLSVKKNYVLLYPRRTHNASSEYLDDPWRASNETFADTVLFANYKTEKIVLSNLPLCRKMPGRKIDIKKITVTPASSLTPGEAAKIGPVLSYENWKNNNYYWLKQVHCQDSVSSYLILSINTNLNTDPRIFMINIKDHRLTSVVRVSSLGYRDVYNGLLYRYSECFKGRLKVNLEYDNNASSPLVLYLGGVDDLVWYSILKKENKKNLNSALLLRNPEGSQYEIFLDKDGYLTRR